MQNYTNRAVNISFYINQGICKLLLYTLKCVLWPTLLHIGGTPQSKSISWAQAWLSPVWGAHRHHKARSLWCTLYKIIDPTFISTSEDLKIMQSITLWLLNFTVYRPGLISERNKGWAPWLWSLREEYALCTLCLGEDKALSAWNCSGTLMENTTF